MLVVLREMTLPRQDEVGVEAHGLASFAPASQITKLHRSFCTSGEREISGGFALLKSGGQFSVPKLALGRREAWHRCDPASTEKHVFDERRYAE